MQERAIRIAILDLYEGFPNQGMRGIRDIIRRYREEHSVDIYYEVFDVRKENHLPGTDFDIYISSGGPGSPLDSVGSDWDKNYISLIDRLEAHNRSGSPDKKHVFFICHSFQILCRHYRLGTVCLRNSPSFGIFPTHMTGEAGSEIIFDGMPDPFYVVDSRKWQVISPDMKRFEAIGATLLALEKERPHVPLERCMMAIRFNDYFFGTQFHPEADPQGMLEYLHTEEKKKEVIDEHGAEKYEEMLSNLEDPDKIRLTQRLMIPNFLTQAITALKGAGAAMSF